MIFLVILNNKGGVGKTTSAVNLAAWFAETGRKTLLIDMDPSACASLHLGFDKSKKKHKTLCDFLLEGEEKLDNYINPVDGFDSLSCITSEAALSDFYDDLKQDEEEFMFISRKSLKKQFDIVVFDSPPNMGSLTLNALAVSDYVLIPVQTQYLALTGLELTVKLVERAKRHVNKKLKILGYFGTQFDRRTNASKEVLSILRKDYGKKVFNTTIGVNTKLIEAYHAQKPVHKYARSAKGSKEYSELAEEVLKRIKKQSNK